MDTANSHPAPSAIRAPRLTENRLADLDEVVRVLDENIEGLADSLTYWAMAEPKTPSVESLHARLKLRHDALTRGRAWLAGKIEAERNHRADPVSP